MKDGTYRAYERAPDTAKHTRLDYVHALRFAQCFGVNWEWLLNGVGSPALTPDHDEAEASDTPLPNHLRAWREYKGLTRGQLAKTAGTTADIIAQLESGEVDLSQKRLATLAAALKTNPGFLAGFDPNDVDPAFIEEAMNVSKEDRPQVMQILRTFRARR